MVWSSAANSTKMRAAKAGQDSIGFVIQSASARRQFRCDIRNLALIALERAGKR